MELLVIAVFLGLERALGSLFLSGGLSIAAFFALLRLNLILRFPRVSIESPSNFFRLANMLVLRNL